MAFCPKCFTEYASEVNQCSDCQEKLVKALPPDPNQMDLFEMVEIYKIPDEITAMALNSFMVDAGIEAHVQCMDASFYGGALNVMLGYWGKLLVPRDSETKARKLLEAFVREFHGK